MIARDWIGWDQLSYTDQLFAIWGAVLGLMAYMLLRSMFGWLFAGLARRGTKARAKRKKAKAKGRR